MDTSAASAYGYSQAQISQGQRILLEALSSKGAYHSVEELSAVPPNSDLVSVVVADGQDYILGDGGSGIWAINLIQHEDNSVTAEIHDGRSLERYGFDALTGKDRTKIAPQYLACTKKLPASLTPAELEDRLGPQVKAVMEARKKNMKSKNSGPGNRAT